MNEKENASKTPVLLTIQLTQDEYNKLKKLTEIVSRNPCFKKVKNFSVDDCIKYYIATANVDPPRQFGAVE